MNCFKLVALFVAIVAVPVSATPITVLSYSVTECDKYNFEVTFNRMPDFLTVDGNGNQADAFAFYIDRDNRLPFFWAFNTDILVSGGEIYKNGDIPIRDITLSPEPGSGTWGQWGGVVEWVPYDVEWMVFSPVVTLIDPIFVTEYYRVTFSVDKWIIDPDEEFSYSIQVYQYGVRTFHEFGRPEDGKCDLPEPSTMVLGLMGLVFTFPWRKYL